MNLNLHKQASPVKTPSGGVDAPQPIKPIFKSQQLLLQKAMKAEEEAANAPQEQEEPDLSPLFELQKTELENQFLKQQLKLKEMHHQIEKGMVPDEKGGEDVKIEGPHPAELKAHKAQLQVQLLEHKLKLIEAGKDAEGQKEQGPHPAELEAHKAKMEAERIKHELALKETQHKHEKDLAQGTDAQTKSLFGTQLKHLHSRIEGVHKKMLKSGSWAGLEKWAIAARPVPAGTGAANPLTAPPTPKAVPTTQPSGPTSGAAGGPSLSDALNKQIPRPGLSASGNPFRPAGQANSSPFRPAGQSPAAGTSWAHAANPSAPSAAGGTAAGKALEGQNKMTNVLPGKTPGASQPLGSSNFFGAVDGINRNTLPDAFKPGDPSIAATPGPNPTLNTPTPVAPGSSSPAPDPRQPNAGGPASTTGTAGQPAAKQSPAWFQERQNAMLGGIKGRPSMGNGGDFSQLKPLQSTVPATQDRIRQVNDTDPRVVKGRQAVQNDPNTTGTQAHTAAMAQRTADATTIRNGGTIQATGPHGERYGTVSGSPMAATVPGSSGQASKVDAPGGGFHTTASAEASLLGASEMLHQIIKQSDATVPVVPQPTPQPAAPQPAAPQPAAPQAGSARGRALVQQGRQYQQPTGVVKAPEVGAAQGALDTAMGGVEKARQWSMTKDPDYFRHGKQYGEAATGPDGHKGIRAYLAGGLGNVQDTLMAIPNFFGNAGKAVVRGVTNDIPQGFNQIAGGVKDTVGGAADMARTLKHGITGQGDDSIETLGKQWDRTKGGLKNLAGGAGNVLGGGLSTALDASMFLPGAGAAAHVGRAGIRGALKGMVAPTLTFMGAGTAANMLHAGDSRPQEPVSDQKAISTAPSPDANKPAAPAAAPAAPNPMARLTEQQRALQGLPNFAGPEGYFGANPLDPSKSTANVDWARGLRYDNPIAQAAVQFAPSLLGMVGMAPQVRPSMPNAGMNAGFNDLVGSSPTNSYYSDFYQLFNNPYAYGIG